MVGPPEFGLGIERSVEDGAALAAGLSVPFLNVLDERLEFLLDGRKVLDELRGLLADQLELLVQTRGRDRFKLSAGFQTRPFDVQFVALATQLLDPGLRRRGRVVDYSLQRTEDELQARFGDDERALPQGVYPAQHALRFGGQLVVQIVPLVRILAVHVAGAGRRYVSGADHSEPGSSARRTSM